MVVYFLLMATDSNQLIQELQGLSHLISRAINYGKGVLCSVPFGNQIEGKRVIHARVMNYQIASMLAMPREKR